jgi:hypothetical protein
MPFGFRHHLDDILVLLSRAIAVNIGNDIVYLLLVFLLLLQLLDEGTDFFLIEGAPYKLLRGTLMNQEKDKKDLEEKVRDLEKEPGGETHTAVDDNKAQDFCSDQVSDVLIDFA